MTRLPLEGQLPVRKDCALPVARKGFRVFFLLAAAFAAAVVPLWIFVLTGVLRTSEYFAPIDWHAHEMLFGYTVAVIAGFLLTAVGNWTGRETATGGLLFGLGGLWALGRIVLLVAPIPPLLVAFVDLAFLPALAAVLARPLIAARNRRNYVMLAVIGVLWCANLGMHLDRFGASFMSARTASIVAVDVVVFLIVVVAARILPMFTRNATSIETIRSVPALDVAAAIATGAVVVLDAVPSLSFSAPFVAGVAGVLLVIRSIPWGARYTLREPLLWILHVGHGFIALGLVLRACAAFTDYVPFISALHAITAGGFGCMTLGMMARVTLGHTGRLLRTSRPVTVSFVFLVLAAVVRVAGPFFPESPTWPLHLAATFWALAFLLFLFAFAPALVSGRVDGRAG